jgi:hypothetical protein
MMVTGRGVNVLGFRDIRVRILIRPDILGLLHNIRLALGPNNPSI